MSSCILWPSAFVDCGVCEKQQILLFSSHSHWDISICVALPAGCFLPDGRESLDYACREFKWVENAKGAGTLGETSQSIKETFF